MRRITVSIGCKTSTFFLSLSIILILLSPTLAESNPTDKGKQIFNSKCTPCHTIGGGRKVGPDLRGVAGNHPKSWLFSFISDPEKMFSINDPTATSLLKEYQIKMPNMGLSSDNVNAVINYLETQTSAAMQSEANPPAKTEAEGHVLVADAGRGKKYFSGEIGFKNNGPPCIACHSTAGLQFWGGGNLGPDLTSVYMQLGDGIISVLVTVPFPTMKPIFDSHPLLENEARDLAAYLKGISSQHVESNAPRIIAGSCLAFVILMVIILFLWRNRIKNVRKAMVEKAQREADN